MRVHSHSRSAEVLSGILAEDEAHDDFRRRYARERETGRFLAAKVVEIADTVPEGKKVKISQKDGTTEEHGDQVDRSRLMVDARKWLASKPAPKKYGQRSLA